MSDDSTIIHCPHCNGKLRIASPARTQEAVCGHCKKRFGVAPEEGVADAILVPENPDGVSSALHKENPVDHDDRQIKAAFIVSMLLVAWIFASDTGLALVSDFSSWSDATFQWARAGLILKISIVVAILGFVLIWIIGSIVPRWENALMNLFVGVMFGVPTGLALSPAVAWLGHDQAWRTQWAELLPTAVPENEVDAAAVIDTEKVPVTSMTTTLNNSNAPESSPANGVLQNTPAQQSAPVPGVQTAPDELQGKSLEYWRNALSNTVLDSGSRCGSAPAMLGSGASNAQVDMFNEELTDWRGCLSKVVRNNVQTVNALRDAYNSGEFRNQEISDGITASIQRSNQITDAINQRGRNMTKAIERENAQSNQSGYDDDGVYDSMSQPYEVPAQSTSLSILEGQD